MEDWEKMVEVVRDPAAKIIESLEDVFAFIPSSKSGGMGMFAIALHWDRPGNQTVVSFWEAESPDTPREGYTKVENLPEFLVKGFKPNLDIVAAFIEDMRVLHSE